MPNPTHHLDAINSHGVGVRIAFHRNGDQLSHTVYGIRRTQIDAILSSVDALDANGWPLSIPVQEVRQTRFATGGTALVLMGAAASGHWSATVRMVQFENTNPYLEFDVAVRLRHAPGFMGAAYRSLGEAAWAASPEAAVTLANCGRHTLAVAAPLGAADEESLADTIRSADDAERHRTKLFVPTAELPPRYPATYRWQYCIASLLA